MSTTAQNKPTGGRIITMVGGTLVGAIRDYGMSAPDRLVPGKFHRFPGVGKGPCNTAGWAIAFQDGIGGLFGDWATGDEVLWRKSDEMLRAPHRPTFTKQAAYAHLQQDSELKAVQMARAFHLYEGANPADPCHPYLKAKGVHAADGVRQVGDRLLIPLLNPPPRFLGLQTIDASGEKLFSGGTKVKGAYFTLSATGDESVLAICEGYATGATISVATGWETVIAFNAGNLLPVAESIRSISPAAKLVICADNDHPSEAAGKPNAGLMAGRIASQAAQAFLAAPPSDGGTDWNDYAQQHGVAAVGHILLGAIGEAEVTNPKPIIEAPPVLLLQRGDAVVMQPIDWLWDGWLAAGKFHIMAGVAGTGKSTLALGLAVPITVGGAWPDGSPAGLGNVLIWSGEDTIPDVIAPRLTAMGADMRRVSFIAGVKDGSGELRTFDPSTDMPLLEEAFQREPGIKLLIIDPVMSMVPGDSNKNSVVRAALQPLVDLAERYGCAVLGITHFSKGTKEGNPLERVTGSLAFGALARVVMVVAKSNDEEDTRVVMRAKSNIAPDTGGFKFGLTQVAVPETGMTASCVVWRDCISQSAQQILDSLERQQQRETGALPMAKQWLRQRLADGPVPSKTIMIDAKNASISTVTLRRAAQELGVKPGKEGMRGGWAWELLEGDQATPKMLIASDCAPSGGLEHLRDSEGSGRSADDERHPEAATVSRDLAGGDALLVESSATKLNLDQLQQMLSKEAMTLKVSNGQIFYADRSGTILRNPVPSGHLSSFVEQHEQQIVSMLATFPRVE